MAENYVQLPTDASNTGKKYRTVNRTIGANDVHEQVVQEAHATTIATNQVSVTTSSTLIVASRVGRRGLTIVNHGTTDVYIGVTGLTTSNGLLLVGVKGAGISLETEAAIYGIVGTGTQTVSYLEQY